MIRFMPESRWPGRAVPVGLSLIPVKAIKAPVEFIQLIETSNLGIRHQTHLGNNMAPDILSSNKEVTKGSAGMMMVTRLWREPGMQDSRIWCPRVHLEPGWDLASCRHMTSAISLT